MSPSFRQWRDRTSAWWTGWRGDLLMVGLACGLVLLAFPTVAFDGRTFTTGWKAVGVNGYAPPPEVDIPEDGIRSDAGASAWQFDPWAEVTSRAWHDGDVPLWNPYQGMGTPHAAAFQTAVFDPFLAAVNLHPTPLMWDLSFFLALFLGAAAMYLFLRQVGLDRLPALVGTAPFVLSGFFFLYSNNHFFRSYLYLPLLLLLAQRTVRSRNVLAAVGLGLAVAGNLLVGMPEPSMFVLGALALYCLFLLAIPPVPIQRGAAFLRFAGAAALGLALAAPLLLPGFEFLALSFSAHEPGAKLGLLADSAPQSLRWIMPYALGEKGPPFAATRNWVGAASALAAVGALACPRVLRRHGGWFFFVLGAAILAKGYGLPALRWVGELPVLERAIFPVYSMPLVGFCAAVLVGIGVQGLVDADVRRGRFLVLVGVLSVGVLALVWANRRLLGALPDSHLVRHVALATVAAGAVAAGFVWGRRVGWVVVSAAVVVELLLLAPRGFQVERIDAFVRPGWLEYVVERAGRSQERVFGSDAKLFPNTAGAYGLQDIHSLNALYPDRYVDYIRHFIQPEFVDRFVSGPFGSEQGRGETDDNPMFDLTGVRYVVTGGQRPGDGLIRDFFRARPASGGVQLSAFGIEEDRRTVLRLRSGARATWAVPAGATHLAFAVILDPAAFTSAANGVDVYVVRSGGGVAEALWSESLVPGTAPKEPQWQEVALDLRGSTSVDLVVVPRAGPGADVGFADLRFGFGTPPPERQYRLVASSDGADVWENTRRLPRALVLHQATPVRDRENALEFFRSVSREFPSGALRVDRFDPARQAVVEDLAPSAARRLTGCATPGQATIRSYDTNNVVLVVDTKCPGVVLLTDMYYPGWKARVNGRSAPLHPTDLAFRGVLVEAGQSTVELHYHPDSFRAGTAIALTAALAALTALGLTGLGPLRRTKRCSGRISETRRPNDFRQGPQG